VLTRPRSKAERQPSAEAVVIQTTATYASLREAIDRLTTAVNEAERSLSINDLDPFDVYAPQVDRVAEGIEYLIASLAAPDSVDRLDMN
jgi:hypothetical protein